MLIMRKYTQGRESEQKHTDAYMRRRLKNEQFTAYILYGSHLNIYRGR